MYSTASDGLRSAYVAARSRVIMMRVVIIVPMANTPTAIERITSSVRALFSHRSLRIFCQRGLSITLFSRWRARGWPRC